MLFVPSAGEMPDLACSLAVAALQVIIGRMTARGLKKHLASDARHLSCPPMTLTARARTEGAWTAAAL